jgi:hypothetical protein
VRPPDLPATSCGSTFLISGELVSTWQWASGGTLGNLQIVGKEVTETTALRVPGQQRPPPYHYILTRYLGPSL